jgi:hypothetical protein
MAMGGMTRKRRATWRRQCAAGRHAAPRRRRAAWRRDTMPATGDTTTRHDGSEGRHDDGKGQHGNGRHDDGNGRHDNCKNYCSCTPGKWICKYCHGGHIVAELKCVNH